MPPPGVLRDQLADARATGVSFADSWQAALVAALGGVTDRTERERWTTALTGTRGAWERACECQPARPVDLALVAVAEDRAMGGRAECRRWRPA